MTTDFFDRYMVFVMSVRGIRGATTVTQDNSVEVLSATRVLLEQLLTANQIDNYEDIVSVFFTTTPDLTSVFPAEAARELGMKSVPLICASEIAVKGAMPRCIRVMLHVNTSQKQSEVVHVYLNEAQKLRPDVASAQ
ncbi:Chorismate mutase AroH [Gimesia aquarii]|uniref:chorismate mutase n=2 Tax=Gimesia aquarii TaxID=2527964 RepID=A0A517W1I1_9PLAN|nr:Chorismate mutase AroH [Gimesia aquarii]